MVRITKDWITTYFEHGVDYQNRRLFLMADIDYESARALIQGLKLFEKANAEPIEVYVGTFGGDMYDMFGLYDMIRACPCHIKTIAVGKVMSAGPLILTAGDERLTYRNTWFMVHECGWNFDGKFSDHRAEVEHVKQLADRWAALMEAGSKTPAKRWLKFLKGPDYSFDAPEALELGIVDKILEE